MLLFAKIKLDSKRSLNNSAIQAGLEIDRFLLKDTFPPEETLQRSAENYANMKKEKVMEAIRIKEELCTAKIKVSSKSNFLLGKIWKLR